MKRVGVWVYLLLATGAVQAQSSGQLVQALAQRYAGIKTLRADVVVTTEIPSVQISPVQAKLVYKRPGRLSLKSSGIAILPRLPSGFSWETLADTTRFTALLLPPTNEGHNRLQQLQLIPVADTGELMLARIWLNENLLPVKSQLTTRSQGTIVIENRYGKAEHLGLPDQMIFIVDLQQFKLPKA
ncbi:MAG: hypothetical protein NZL95_00530, partial [Chitinophagales bacterium]|nr:hypothetical protein [Chitinophagales bacterium]MDW8427024.1 hypothetical protein [Chitinophagales bacterium]